jgi:branched-chain amino acid transport system permease protein
VQLAINVLVLTALYAILAEGFVLIYRASRVFNLAHGDVMMLGGYVFFTCLVSSGGNLWLAVPLALCAGLLIGVAVYFAGIRPLAGYPVASIVLVTVAIGILIRSLATLTWSAQTRFPASLLPFKDAPHAIFGNAVVSTLDIALLGVALVYFAVLALLLQRTALGVRMRAAAENPRLAANSGINIHRVIALSWGLACFGATLAAMFYTTRVNLEPDSWLVGLRAFAPALIGGMTSPLGVLPGALIVALVEVLAAQYLDPIMVNSAAFIVLLVALWIRPWGLFGTREEVVRV